MTDILTEHIMVKLVVSTPDDGTTLNWVAYGLDTSVHPAMIVSTGGSTTNTGTAGSEIVSDIHDEWEGA